jgi:DNA-binding HxlR family transcriptional regulator
MKAKMRSTCPICYSLDVFGDKWSLLIIRDLLLAKKRYYREFLSSPEGIATNILADRLKKLVDADLATRQDDPANRGQPMYSPTKKATALIPVLSAMAEWSLQYGPKSLKVPDTL